MFLQISGTEQIILLIISILIAMVVHEAMHGYVANWLGDTTAADLGRLTLNPLKSIDPLYTIVMPIVFILILKTPLIAAKPVPINSSRLKYGEYGMALVGLAGPATNFVMAAIGAILFRTIGIHSDALIYNFLVIFTEINVVVMIFNLIPIPPLDGSRVLYAFAPEPLKEVMERIESLGLFVILFFVILIYTVAPIFNGLETIEVNIINFLLG